MVKSLSIVVASDDEGGIGKNGMLPWRIPEDLHHFKTLTTIAPIGKVNAIIMGRRTWDSLPIHPLPHRVNIVVSSSMQKKLDDVLICKDFENALQMVATIDNLHNVFIIGGCRMYTEALLHPKCIRVYLTHVRGQFDSDVFFPINELKTMFCLVNEGNLKCWRDGQNDIIYSFDEYLRDGKIE